MEDKKPFNLEQIIDEAAAHHARIASGGMRGEDWAELETWITQSPEHREVFVSMGQLSDAMSELGASEGGEEGRDIPTGLDRLLDEPDDVVGISSATRRRSTWMKPRYLAVAAALVAPSSSVTVSDTVYWPAVA